MSVFRVGQRVRVRYVRDSRFQFLAGRETVITEGLLARTGNDGMHWFGYRVAIDPHFAPKPDQLEPVTPSGHRPSEYTFTELMDRCRAGRLRMSKPETEVLRRVWDANEPVALTVGWGEDGFGVCLYAAEDKAKEWWGEVRLTFGASYAIELGKALIAAGEEGKERGQ